MGSQGFFQVLKRVLLFALIIGMMVIYAACSKKGDSSSSSGSTSPGTSPTPSPSPSPVPPFEVVISSQYEAAGITGGSTTTEADCQIPIGSSIPTTINCTNTAGAATTSVAIPEGRLYYSALTFTMNVPYQQSNCEIVLFQPFSYQASNSAAFAGPWTSPGATVDCSKSPLPATCYGGPAIDIISGFPQFTSVAYTTADGNTFSATAHSANYHHWGSNRFASNDYAVKAAHTWKNNDEYLSGWNDYVFTCFDKYMNVQYQIDLTISDLDTGSGANCPATQPQYPANPLPGCENFWPDWNTLSWDY